MGYSSSGAWRKARTGMASLTATVDLASTFLPAVFTPANGWQLLLATSASLNPRPMVLKLGRLLR
jgi:hypothetical protein